MQAGIVRENWLEGFDGIPWLCQTNLNRPAKVAGLRRSSRKLTPLGQGGRAVLLEAVTTIEVAVLIEMIRDRGVDGGEFLQGFNVPKLRHRPLSSSERLMRVFGPVVEPATADLSGSVTDHIHRRTV